jgi:hypothetical protein
MRLEVVKDESAQHKFTALQGTTSHMAYHIAHTCMSQGLIHIVVQRIQRI